MQTPFVLDELPPHCGVEMNIRGDMGGARAIRFRAVIDRHVTRGRLRRRTFGYTTWYDLTLIDQPIRLRWAELTSLAPSPADDDPASAHDAYWRRRKRNLTIGSIVGGLIAQWFVWTQLTHDAGLLFAFVMAGVLGFFVTWLCGQIGVALTRREADDERSGEIGPGETG